MFDDDKESMEEDFLHCIKKLRTATDEIIGGSLLYRAFSMKSGFDATTCTVPCHLEGNGTPNYQHWS